MKTEKKLTIDVSYTEKGIQKIMTAQNMKDLKKILHDIKNKNCVISGINSIWIDKEVKKVGVFIDKDGVADFTKIMEEK